MNDIDRLVELIKEVKFTPFKDGGGADVSVKHQLPDHAFEAIAYKLLESGVIVPSCALGQKVWWTEGCKKFTPCVEVTRVTCTVRYGIDYTGITRNGTARIFNERDIGRHVFLTKKEAEEALKSKQDKESGKEEI